MPICEQCIPTFDDTLNDHQIQLERQTISTLQINVGKRCNQSCAHCHVDAGPWRDEMMTATTFDRLSELLAHSPAVQTVDITGGAPELNPNFRPFVKKVRALGRNILLRCNLTVLFEPGQEDTAAFLVQQRVEVVASLPCYLEDNVNNQRGDGVFAKSIKALKRLNALGYGQPDAELQLNLVYNPGGAHLPPSQDTLEEAYHEQLMNRFGIVFNRLYTLSNIPVTRYAQHLHRHKQYDDYLNLLVENFNPSAARNLMCLHQVSVAWDGSLYDCDFNQMVNLPVGGEVCTIWDIERLEQVPRCIATAEHCFGCSAGSGSSCGGALV